MLFRIRSLGFVAALGLAAAAAFAQEWSVGATYGAVADLERSLQSGGFHPYDVTAWVDFRMEPLVLLRASYVSMRTTGDNAGRSASVVPGQPPAPLPDLKVGINALTVDVSYLFFDNFFTSGFFGGIGGYRIQHAAASNPELKPFLDPNQTVFGFNVGADGDFKIVQHVSAVGRLTFHGILSYKTRWLLVASAGIAIHF